LLFPTCHSDCGNFSRCISALKSKLQWAEWGNVTMDFLSPWFYVSKTHLWRLHTYRHEDGFWCLGKINAQWD
jgi:hypothetical protein